MSALVRMIMEAQPRRRDALSWFPIQFVHSYCKVTLFWTIRHVDYPSVVFLSPDDWEQAYPGTDDSPMSCPCVHHEMTFIAFAMPKNLHDSLVPPPENYHDRSTWSVVYTSTPSRWSIVKTKVKAFKKSCRRCCCCCCGGGSDPRTHAT